MASRVLCMLFLLFHIVFGNDNNKNEGFMDHLNSGMKFAQNLLGSESVALKVADFVLRAFQTVKSPGNSNIKRHPQENYFDDSTASQDQYYGEKPHEYNSHKEQTVSPWRYLVRLLGLQPNQISAVAVNAVIFVALMLTTFLAGPRRPSKPYRSDDPTDWILNKNSKKLQDLIATAKNESLPQLIEDLIEQQDNLEETSCIRLLFCKITPIVSRMQKAVFGKEDKNDINKELRGVAIMYRHLPTEQEIKDTSEVCEKRFKQCDLNE